ncbi:hypothetical protein [Streptomyces sp. bgisy060]|uniref:hypothetical protein n=1 Tax=Streptomyces sp. bgisy060 TaxID=3413775 RepID=UPI003EBF1FF1
MATPDDIITGDVLALAACNHGTLAPEIAETRYQAVRRAFGKVESLRERWEMLSEDAANARQTALVASAEAADSGRKMPTGSAAKVLEAELAADGCVVAIRKAIADLRNARRAYDALWNDMAFVAEYRETVAAEFLKRRKTVLKAFKELDVNLPALAELYGTLGEFTLDHLLRDSVNSIEYNGEPLTHGGVFLRTHASWTAPKLSEAMAEVRRFVTNDDPITGGTLLAEDLDTVAAALPELAEKRYEEWQDELARIRVEKYGVEHHVDTGRRYG